MTTTIEETLGEVLQQADPNTLADALRKVGVAVGAPVIKVTAAALTAADAFAITSEAFAALAGVSVDGIADPGDGESLPPIGKVCALQVTAGAANTPGPYVVLDDAATAANLASNFLGLATMDDDGTTITFAASSDITGFILHYMPRTKTPLENAFANS